MYAKLPTDIADRWVLLLDPMLGEDSRPIDSVVPRFLSYSASSPPCFPLSSPFAATGGSVIRAIKVLEEHKVPTSRIIFVNLIASPEGIKLVHDSYPEVRIITGWVDEGLNEKNYIVPGLGDFGDLYMGT